MKVVEAPNLYEPNNRGLRPPGLTRAKALQVGFEDHLQRMSKDRRAEIAGKHETIVAKNGLHLRLVDDTGKKETVPLPLTITPAFLEKETMHSHIDDVQSVYGALLRIEDLAFSDTPLGEKVLKTVLKGMSPEQAELVHQAKTRYKDTSRNRNSRADAFIRGDKMDVIEFNNVNPEGLVFHKGMVDTTLEVMEEMAVDLSSKTDIEAAKNRTAAHQALHMLTREGVRRNGRVQKIGVIYDQDPPAKGESDISLMNRSELPEFANFVDTISRGTIDAVIGGPQDVSVENGKIAVKDKPVEIMWRNAVDIPKASRDPQSSGFMEVISNPHKYPVLNDETSQIIGSKATLSLLYDRDVQRAIRMTDRERSAIERSIPFSFIPEDDVFLDSGGERLGASEYLKKYREHFVLKPSTGTHGTEVIFGANGNGEWDAAVDKAVQTGEYIAQRFIPYEDIKVPILQVNADGNLTTTEYYRDTNIQKIGPETQGTVLSRFVPRRGEEITILNVAGGGGLQPTFIV